MKNENKERIVCNCGKGHASRDKESAHYGTCNLCYRKGLSRKELNKLGLKRP